MKIIAVYDSDGRILAAVMDDGYGGPRPVPAEGTQVGTFNVSAEVHSLGLEEICTRFRIDSKSQDLVGR
jgi:hypothetical protein